MVPVPVTVRLVGGFALNVFPAIVQVPEPKAHVLAVVLLPSATAEVPENVKLNVDASNVPLCKSRPFPDATLLVNASCRVTDPLGVFTVKFCVNVLPALVIVWLPRPAKVSVPVPVMVVPVPLIQFP